MARPKGQPKIGGRVKGTPNKLSMAAKEAIQLAFDKIGGVDRLISWALEDSDNLKVFYTSLYSKLIPLEHAGSVGLSVEIIRLSE